MYVTLSDRPRNSLLKPSSDLHVTSNAPPRAEWEVSTEQYPSTVSRKLSVIPLMKVMRRGTSNCSAATLRLCAATSASLSMHPAPSSAVQTRTRAMRPIPNLRILPPFYGDTGRHLSAHGFPAAWGHP